MARLRMKNLLGCLFGSGSLILYLNFKFAWPPPILINIIRMSQSDLQATSKPVCPGRKLLIVSLPRTGSSFLGQIFNQHPEVFFLYEPLHTLTTFVKANHTTPADYSENVTHFLINIYNCRFHRYQDYLTFISHPGLSSSHFRLSSRALSSPPLCKMGRGGEHARQSDLQQVCPPLQSKATSKVCAHKKHVVVKVLSHRISRSSLLKLLKSEFSLRIVHLVRDPRAITWSLLKMRKPFRSSSVSERTINTTASQFDNQIQTICRQMSEDLATAEIIQNFTNREAYRTLRFEDLATNPTSTVKEIFEFVGISVLPETARWIRENMNSKEVGKEIDSYSTTGRNASVVMNAWKDSLAHDQVIRVEKLCSTVMHKLGYHAKGADTGEATGLAKRLH